MYEPIADDEASYIKLINLQSKVICNRVHGRLGLLIAGYLMSIHIAPRPIYLVRAGHCEGAPHDVDFLYDNEVPSPLPLSSQGSDHSSHGHASGSGSGSGQGNDDSKLTRETSGSSGIPSSSSAAAAIVIASHEPTSNTNTGSSSTIVASSIPLRMRAGAAPSPASSPPVSPGGTRRVLFADGSSTVRLSPKSSPLKRDRSQLKM